MAYYKIKDYAAVAGNYAQTFAIATGAAMLGANWTIAVGTGLSVAVLAASVKLSSNYLEKRLAAHPAEHIHSPNLKKMVDKLYGISGLKVDKNPVYDFKSAAKTKESIMDVIIGETLEKAAAMPNAAASNINKPVIIISEPLLQLLTDDEEYAVLAHEFVHAGAQHQWATMPKNFLNSASAISNSLVSLTQFFAAGFVGIATSIAASAGVGYVLNKATSKNNNAPRSLKNVIGDHVVEAGQGFASMAGMRQVADKLDQAHESRKGKVEKARTPEELLSRMRKKSLKQLATQVTAVGTISAFNPLYLGVYAAVRTMNTGLLLSTKKLSRIFEFHADRNAVQIFDADPLALVTALRKINTLVERSQTNANGFSRKDVKISKLGSAWAQMKATHPSVPERAEALSAIARKMGADEAAIDRAVNGDLDIANAPDLPLDVAEAIAMQFHIESSLV